MSDALEAKALEWADKFAGKVGELAQQYGPDVVDAALMVVRVDAASKLVAALVVTAGAGAGLYFASRLFREGIRLHRIWNLPETRYSEPDGMWQTLIGGFGGLAAIVVGLISGTALINVWTWVAIADPKLAIAKRVLEKVL